MMTPAQAGQVWCPMVRIGVMPSHGGPLTVNDPESIREFQGRCIADKCAMWRWEGPEPAVERTHESVQARSSRAGYCGLAGRPV